MAISSNSNRRENARRQIDENRRLVKTARQRNAQRRTAALKGERALRKARTALRKVSSG